MTRSMNAKPNKHAFLLCVLLFLAPGGIALVFFPQAHARRALLLLTGALVLGALLALLLPRALSRRSCRRAAGLLTAVWLGTMLLSSGVYALGAAGSWAAAPESGADRSALFGGRTVLVLAPHPDDEINLAGGVIEEYTAAGSRVILAFANNGDVFFPAEVRFREALDAAAALSVGAEDVIFLGYGGGTAAGHARLFEAETPTVSYSGESAVYGAAGIAPWREGRPFTREAFLAELKDLLSSIRPDVIVCCDNDPDVEHRTLSILFERAMGQLLREDPAWRPTVLRAFAYSTGWLAPDDFRCGQLASVDGEAGTAESSSRHTWARRLRLPVSESAVSLLSPELTSVGKALRCHASQDAALRAGRLVNADKVFFPRRTDSLLYGAEVRTSSGNGAYLHDFVLADTEDLGSLGPVLAGNVWSPDTADGAKTAVFTFPEPVEIAALTLWDSPDPAANVLAGRIGFDGGEGLDFGPLDPSGDAVELVLEQPVRTRTLTLTLLSGEGEGYGLAELEAFAAAEPPALPFWKFTDADGTYLYDVLLPAEGSPVFSWTAHDMDPGEVVLSADDPACAVVREGDAFTVSCPAGKSCVVTARDRAGNVLDAVRFSNPRPLVRRWIEHFDFFAAHRAARVWDHLRAMGHAVRMHIIGG